MSLHWSKIAERGNTLGLKILVVSYQLVGRWLAKLLLFPIIMYFYLTGKAAREASSTFLQKARAVNNQLAPTWLDGYKHFLAFGNAALDKVDSWLGKIDNSRIDYTNYHHFEALQRSKSGAIFIGSHLGNLEVCRALSNQKYPVRINVLVFTQHAEAFNQMLQQLNPDVSLDLIQVTNLGPDIAILLKERIENGEYVVIVGDRTPIENPGRVVECDFLGEKAPFSQGPLILASLLECPVYLLFCLKDNNRFRVIFEAFSESKLVFERKHRQQQIAEKCQLYADKLAYYAVRYPYQWFNFFDFWQHDFATRTQDKK